MDILIDLSDIPQFQSTLPRGSDRMADLRALMSVYFNPRSLAGATNNQPSINDALKISIHAPSRERL